MTGWTLTAIAAAGAFAVTDWVAVARRSKALEYVCKPAAIAGLIAAALLLEITPWIVVALALSLVGDVFLMLPRDRFREGLASFLLAHLAYIQAFRTAEGPGAGPVVAAVAAAIGALTVGRRILRGVRESGNAKLAAPVALYMTAISVMLVVAARVPLAGIGAALFYASDALIAWTRFVRAYPWARVVIIVTYHLGQACLVLSLA